MTSTSTVGLPRESRISRAWTRRSDIGSPGWIGVAAESTPHVGAARPSTAVSGRAVRCSRYDHRAGRRVLARLLAARAAADRGDPSRPGHGRLRRRARRRADRAPRGQHLRPRSRRSTILDPVRRELDEYFDGRRRSFDLPIDWVLVRGFAREVLQRTADIPTERCAATPRLPPTRAARAPGARRGERPPWQPDADRGAVPPGSSPATAASAGTVGGSTASASCSRWRADRVS